MENFIFCAVNKTEGATDACYNPWIFVKRSNRNRIKTTCFV